MPKIIKKPIVALTWGCWDMFHFGHLRLLERAKKKCDKLIVCVSTDEYINKHKGHYPIIGFRQRLAIIKVLKCVDVVDMQSFGYDKKEAIKRHHPSILFVGDDHKKDYTGKGLGVKVCYLSYTKGISTTIIKERILKTGLDKIK